MWLRKEKRNKQKRDATDHASAKTVARGARCLRHGIDIRYQFSSLYVTLKAIHKFTHTLTHTWKMYIRMQRIHSFWAHTRLSLVNDCLVSFLTTENTCVINYSINYSLITRIYSLQALFTFLSFYLCEDTHSNLILLLLYKPLAPFLRAFLENRFCSWFLIFLEKLWASSRFSPVPGL